MDKENTIYTKTTYFNYKESYEEKCEFPTVYFSELKLHESGNYYESRRIGFYLNGKIQLSDENRHPDRMAHGWYPYPNDSTINKEEFIFEDKIGEKTFEEYWEKLKAFLE